MVVKDIHDVKARRFRFAKQRAFFLKGISNRVSHITELSFQRGVLLHGKSMRTGSSDMSVTSINSDQAAAVSAVWVAHLVFAFKYSTSGRGASMVFLLAMEDALSCKNAVFLVTQLCC